MIYCVHRNGGCVLCAALSPQHSKCCLDLLIQTHPPSLTKLDSPTRDTSSTRVPRTWHRHLDGPATPPARSPTSREPSCLPRDRTSPLSNQSEAVHALAERAAFESLRGGGESRLAGRGSAQPSSPISGQDPARLLKGVSTIVYDRLMTMMIYRSLRSFRP